TFPANILQLQRAIEDQRIRLVIVDPIMSYLGEKIDPNSDHSVRQALTPLARLADETETTFLLIAHLNKGQSPNPLARVGGSMAFVAAARSGLLLARDPDPDADQASRVLCQIKSNLGGIATALTYKVEHAQVSEDGEAIGTARITLVGESPYAAEDALYAPP